MTQSELEASQNSRARLIESAIFCFSEKGFDATGIREIAQRAQANSALVQYHFGGKDGLYNAALKSIFDRKAPILTHEPPPCPDGPEARTEAILALRELIHHLVQELMTCSSGSSLDQAALLMVTREMQAPHSQAIPMVLEHIKPYMDYLNACLRVLRPDLDEEGRLNMHASIYGPVFHLHCNLPLGRILRNDPTFPGGPEAIRALADHFTDFSLRGLGITDAFPNQGA